MKMAIGQGIQERGEQTKPSVNLVNGLMLWSSDYPLKTCFNDTYIILQKMG